jgi:uncharacterized HAD superfamily protein
MGKRLNIGIDVDGVIVDFVSAFRKEAEALLHREFPPFSSGWDFQNWGLTAAEHKAIWKQIATTKDWFYDKPEPLPNALAGLHLLEAHYDLYFVTTRIETAGLPVREQTAAALSDKCYVDFPSVIVSKDKGPVAAALGLSAFVDDKFENLQQIAESSPATRIFIMDQTYNTDIKIPDNWTRVYSLVDFYNKLKGTDESSTK